jgi:RHS repeat-associated protein
VYIYLSNEETTPVEVYFDDFKVTHTKSPVVQMDDYYPFGLTFNSFQRENSTINRWKFQGQEHVDDLGLNWDSFKWRNHQPEIGRFFNVDPLAEKYVYNSPYAFAENKVLTFRELEGLEGVHYMDGNTHVIEKNVRVLVRQTSNDYSARKNRRIERENAAKVERVKSELTSFYSGASNSAGESVRFQFNVEGIQVRNPNNAGTEVEQKEIAIAHGLEAEPAFKGDANAIAPAALITSAATLQSETENNMTVKSDGKDGSIAHEVGHTLLTRGNEEGEAGKGGVMVDPPGKVKSSEVDMMIQDALPKKNKLL